MSDVRDILQLSSPATPQQKSKQFLHGKLTPGQARNTPTTPTSKARSDVPRELRMLTEGRVTLMPSIKSPYKEKRTIREPVKHWVFRDFRPIQDGALVRHWEKEEDKDKEYAFKELNKKIRVFKYSDAEYQDFIKDIKYDDGDVWTRNQTDELFSLCELYNLQFIIIHDRFSGNKEKTKEQLKRHYYTISEKLLYQRVQKSANKDNLEKAIQKHPIILNRYDYDGDRNRIENFKKMYERPQEIIQKEALLREKLKEIERIKKKRILTEKQEKKKYKRVIVRKPEESKESKIPDSNQNNISIPLISGKMSGSSGATSSSQPDSLLAEKQFLFDWCTQCAVKSGSVHLRSLLLNDPNERNTKRIDRVINTELSMQLPYILTPTEPVHQAWLELRKKIGHFLDIQKKVLRKSVPSKSISKKIDRSKKKGRKRTSNGSTGSANDERSPQKRRKRE